MDSLLKYYKHLVLISISLLYSTIIIYSQNDSIEISGTINSNDYNNNRATIEVHERNIYCETKNHKYKIKVPQKSVLIYSATNHNSLYLYVEKDYIEFLDNPADTLKKDKNKSDSWIYCYNDEEFKIKENKANISVILPFKSANRNVSNLNISDIFKPTIFEKRRYSGLNNDNIYLVDFGYRDREQRKIIFTSSYSIDIPNHLPELQNTYSQGRPTGNTNVWNGPETGEIFSWGPKMQNLEFDGSSYPYDKNGKLTGIGTGNGVKAKIYNPLFFLNNGRGFENKLSINFKIPYNIESLLSYCNNDYIGIYPGSKKQRNEFTLKFKKETSSTKFESSTIYTNTNSNFMSNGYLLSRILQNVYTTPVSFDNANGLNSTDAIKNTTSFLLPNGKQRSFSEGNSNNPYFLLNKINDKETNEYFVTSISINPRIGITDGSFIVGTDYSKVDNSFGLSKETVGFINDIFTTRLNKQQSIYANLSEEINKNFGKNELTTGIDYSYRYAQRTLSRKDLFTNNNLDSITNFDNKYTRRTNEAGVFLKYNYNSIFGINLNGKVYNSNTLPKNENNKLMYSTGLYFKLSELFNNHYYFSLIKFRTNYGTNYGELPMSIASGIYGSLLSPVASFVNIYNNSEVLVNNIISPEKRNNFSYGIDVSLFRNKLTFSIDGYINTVQNAFIPIAGVNNQYSLINGADIRYKGIEASLSYRKYEGDFNWELWPSLSLPKTLVQTLYNNQTEVKISGFSDVYSSLISGQPYGVIVGSGYKRDIKNNIVIGADGFPIVENKKIIGDPNPKWIGSIKCMFSYKAFQLVIAFNLRYGGQIWNGTQNVLNYYGVSKLTSEERATTGYIFTGVKEDGTINNIPIDFSNPANGINANRWVRYGIGGIAEEAIQDATSLRISNLEFTWDINKTFRKNHTRILPYISLYCNNIMLWTRYKGVDPTTNLWGLSNGSGLDYFNNPLLKSYGISIRLKF